MSQTFDYKTQVLVVGAGSAGVTAALAAARNGAETLLIERSGFLGGISATLPWLGFHDRDYRQVVKGYAQEFVSDLVANGDGSIPAWILNAVPPSASISMPGKSWPCKSWKRPV